LSKNFWNSARRFGFERFRILIQGRDFEQLNQFAVSQQKQKRRPEWPPLKFSKTLGPSIES